MADDAIMLVQAMDIDNDVPPVPSTGSTPAATPQSLLRIRRNLPNAKEKRRYHDVLKRHRDANIQKHPSSIGIHHRKNLGPADHGKDTASIKRNRKLRIQHAIASGSFLVRSLSNLGEIYGPSAMDQDEPQKLQRLNKDIVAQALCAPLPGMAFDPSSPPSFTEAEMDDLVQVLEAHQMHLASKGKIVLSSEAGRLLRSFAREMMAVVLLCPEKLGCRIGADEFWIQVNLDYLRKKKTRWLTPRVMELLKSAGVNNLPRRPGAKRDDRASSSALADVIMHALDAPGRRPVIDQVRCVIRPSDTLSPWLSKLTASSCRLLLRRARTCPLSLRPSHRPCTLSSAISRPREPDI